MKSAYLLLFFSLLFFQIIAQSTYDQVYSIFIDKCVDCHNPDDLRGDFDLEGIGNSITERKDYLYSKIVNGSTINKYADEQGYKIIYPGRADKSFLFRKINQGLESTIQLHEDAGDPMPARASIVVTDSQKELIRQWILFGAPKDSVIADESLIEDYYTNGGIEAFPNGAPSPPSPGQGFQIKFGPFFLNPNEERELFWKYETELLEDTEVNRIDMDISVYSHHMIIYNYENQTDQEVPPGLRSDLNHNEIGIVAGAQQSQNLLLPSNTAFIWEEDFVLDINSHVINYTTDPLKAAAYINVYTQPSGIASHQMFSIPVPNTEFYIPNDGEEVADEQELILPFGNINVWGLLGHTHKYGTSYKVWTLNDFGQKDELLYDAACPDGIPNCVSPFYDYQHLPTRFFEPLLPVDLSKGIIHEAKWINNGPRDVEWGPTSEDEMMILGIYFTLDTTGLSTTTTRLSNVQQATATPNPFFESTLINLPQSGGLKQLTIFNSSGKMILSRQIKPKISSYKWNAINNPPGLYLYQLRFEDGRFYTGKLIKH